MKKEIDKTVERIKQRGDDHKLYCPTCKAGRNCMDHLMIRENDLQEQVTQLKADLATAKQGLEHYADESFFDDPHPDLGYVEGTLYNFEDELDGPMSGCQIAQQTLAAIGKE